MNVLLRHRDGGSRKLMERIASLLPGVQLLDWPPDQPIVDLAGIDAVIAIGPVGREPMERGRFGFIQTMGTGYDQVDVGAATELGIYVAHLPASQTGNAESVAEHVVLLMLALARRLAEAQENARQGRWAQPVGRALLGKTACIVGLGDVGSALAARLHAFEMHITAIRKDPGKGAPAYVTLSTDLPQAVSQADFVVLCARPNPDNVHLVNRDLLAAMKRGVMMINVSRGSLVDEHALAAALASGHVGGAGLDVFDVEPADPGASPLVHHARVIATPHIAGVTDVNLARSFRCLAENLQRFGRGEVPHFLVNHPLQPRGARKNLA